MIYTHTTSALKQAARMGNRASTNKSYKAQEDTGYSALACAIIKQAVDDYRYAAQVLNGSSKVSEESYSNRMASRAEWVLEDITRFFRGKWYGILCDIPGEVILKKLCEEKRKGA